MWRYISHVEQTYTLLTGSGTVFQGAEWKADSAQEIRHTVLVESFTAVVAPSAASLAVKFQVSPYEYKGQPLDYQTTSDGFPWQDVAAADTMFGSCLLDGDWPASLADQTLVTRKFYIRRFRLGFPGMVRVVLTPSYTGGTSPGFRVTTATTLIY